MERVRVADLRPGDLVDLERDPYADPRGDNPTFESELALVSFVTRETDSCVAVGFDGFDVVGFPPDHAVMVEQHSES